MLLSTHFMPHQIQWIEGEDPIHAARSNVFALAEKSVRIGWTRADAFKNVRKRLRFPNRDYLFATKDYPSALEYMRVAYADAELFDLTCAIISHGEEYLKVPRLDRHGRATAFTDEIKIGVIKFQNGSRIIAFSANPQAMSVYGGDVGLDEFARHPNAELLWETAQGRITWGYDIAVWSAHNGEDSLFYQFAQDARAGRPPWNLYFRVTMPDALQFGLLDKINHARGTQLTADQFLANCRARAGSEHAYQQTYLCNPVPGGASIVDWSVIQRCRADYQILRLHLEHDQVQQQFGPCLPHRHSARENQITETIRSTFAPLFNPAATPSTPSRSTHAPFNSQLSALNSSSASTSPPPATATSPSSTSTKRPPARTTSGSAPSSPVAPTIGTSSKPSCSPSSRTSAASAPPVTNPASAAKSAGKPKNALPPVSSPSTSAHAKTISASTS